MSAVALVMIVTGSGDRGISTDSGVAKSRSSWRVVHAVKRSNRAITVNAKLFMVSSQRVSQ